MRHRVTADAGYICRIDNSYSLGMFVLLMMFFSMYFLVFLEILRTLERLFADLEGKIRRDKKRVIENNNCLANVWFQRSMN